MRMGKNRDGATLDSSGYLIANGNRLNSAGDAIDSSGYLLDADGNRQDTNNGDADDRAPVGERSFVKISDKYRYYFNEETAQIVVTGGAMIKKVGSYNITPSAMIQMSELEGIRTGTTGDFISDFISGSPKLSRSHTLTLSAPATATSVEITITDVTPTEDSSSADRYVQTTIPYQFTVYVVKFDDTVRADSNTVTFSGGTAMTPDLQAVDRSSQRPQAIGFTVGGTDPSDVPLMFKVEGGGQVYARVGNREGPRSSGTREFLLSSAATVYLNMKGRTNTVTVYPRGTNPNVTGRSFIYVSGYANLNITHGDRQTGAPGGRLEEYLGVRVTDIGGNRIPGMVVRFPDAGTDGSGVFIPFPGTTVYVAPGTNALVSTAETATKEFIAESSKHREGAGAMMVKTDSSGEAKVYYAFAAGTPTRDYTISPGLMYNPAVTADFTATAATAGNTRTANLEIVSGNPQSGAKGKNLDSPLVVIARSTGGHRIPDVIIQFRTVTGILSPAPGTMQPTVGTGAGQLPQGSIDPTPSSGQQIYVKTGANGEAGVTYNVGQTVVARDVIAEVRFEAGINQYDFAIDRVTFNVNGRAGTGGGTPPALPPATRTITITLSETTGEPGDEIDVTISASPNTVVVIDSGDLDGDDFSREFGTTPFDTVISLPDEDDEYTFTAEATGYTSDSATVTVETGILGTISISQIGTPSNGAQSFSITVVDTDSARISGSLTVRVSGSGFTTRNVDTLNGVGNARLTLPTAASLYTLTASAEGYTSGTTQVRIAGTGQQEVADEDEEEVEEEVTVAAEPDSIEITGPSTRSGTVNEELDAVLIVRVRDDDDDGVEGARVIFRVVSGRGRLSARGNGRAIGVVTDEDGYARANFTPLDGGTITVRASATGVTRTVEFTITTGSASSASGARDSGTGGTPGPSGPSVSPVVHVVAASRPPMLWVDGGAIYALVGASPQRFAASVDNALNITVGGGKVYWTEKTGESGGTINSANLNGSDVTELTSIMAVPMGIAVDTSREQTLLDELPWENPECGPRRFRYHKRDPRKSAESDGSRLSGW